MNSIWKLSIALAILGVSVWGASKLQTPASPSKGTERQASAPLEGTPIETGPLDAGARTDAEAVAPEDNPLSETLCPPGMTWAAGEFCPAQALSERRCRVRTRQLGVCVDVFEYPNQPGVLPAAMVSFDFARSLCEAEGKRLCTDSEWTLACRGVRRLSACNFGKTSREVDVEQLQQPARVSAELERIDGRRVSALSGCVSEHANYDMLGNLQEWIASEHTGGYSAGLKGGRFNQSSIDCERTIQTRRVDIGYPHTGFRCCADPLVKAPRAP